MDILVCSSLAFLNVEEATYCAGLLTILIIGKVYMISAVKCVLAKLKRSREEGASTCTATIHVTDHDKLR